MQNLPNVSIHKHRHLVGIATGLFGALVLTALCYSPSLSGPFLFDDIPNLEILGERGGLISAEQYLEFIATPRSGPIGRPLSLASFALNAKTWPTDPRPFRITNLVIHLVNGLLLFLLARSIFATAYPQESADKLALFCAVLWLLHPLLVSTTAYIIQRMTQLCALFTLAGLLCYMRGRNCFQVNPTRGWLWIVAGMGGFGLLALLSKETGILLPLYALVIELTVYASTKFHSHNRRVLLAILCAPLIALVTYMIVNWGDTLARFEYRSFTLVERLLTQAIVVVDYLRQIILPELSGLGVIHDDYAVSTGLLSPPVTLLCLLIIVSLISFSMVVRKRLPLISLGILWFFAGHSLEAGPLSLELYFEHRNYLPLLGPLIVAASLLQSASRKIRRLLPFVATLFIVMESFLTWQSAAVWGNEERYIRTMLIEHPNSLRAQQHRANELILSRQYRDALAIQERLAVLFPEHTSTRLSMLNLRCVLKTLTAQEIDETGHFLETSNHDLQIAAYLSVLTNNADARTCPAFNFEELHSLFDSLLRNAKITSNNIASGAVLYNKGMAYKRSGDLRSALQQLDLSYSANPEIDIPIQQTVWLLEAGRPEEAEQYLSRARQHGRNHIIRQSFRDSDIGFLQQEIDQSLSD